MLDMPEKHVERLAMLLHARIGRFCGLRHSDHVWTESRSMIDAPARSGPAARRKVGSASDLRVESCPRQIPYKWVKQITSFIFLGVLPSHS